MQQEPTSFFDRNTILAVILSFAVFFGWQQYMQNKYPDAYLSQSEEPQKTTEIDGEVKPKQEMGSEQMDDTKSVSPEPQVLSENQIHLEYPSFAMTISSQGMAIKDFKIKDYRRRSGEEIIYKEPVQQILLQTTTQFQLKKEDDTTVVGTAQEQGRTYTVIYKIVPDLYLVKISAQVTQSEKSPLSFIASSVNDIVEMPSSFLLPPTDYQEFFVSASGSLQRERLTPETLYKQEYTQAQMASFNSQYFAQVFMNRADISPTFKGYSQNKKAVIEWAYTTAQPQEALYVNYDVYVGPKKEEILQKIDEALPDIIDYGMFSIIGRPMHSVLIYIYKLVGNWGLAIILITILLRTIILPAGVYSFRSMKKMQKLQPKLQAIKEKHKNDPQRANQETLQLLRAEKANPLSGCLPALLQLPIFIAFFTMMSSSFELYMQPFYLWIHDLSSKDPYYVFPILAGATMYFQMKMTPTTTTDPAQQKIMSFMPLLFSVFMLSTPSGLALYMFVGSLFSIFQQVIFMKEKTT